MSTSSHISSVFLYMYWAFKNNEQTVNRSRFIIIPKIPVYSLSDACCETTMLENMLIQTIKKGVFAQKHAHRYKNSTLQKMCHEWFCWYRYKACVFMFADETA